MQNFLTAILIVVILSLNLSPTRAQSSCEIQQWEWAQQITSTGISPIGLKASSSDTDRFGNFYFAGSYDGETNFQDTTISNENISGYVSKFSPEGELLWLYTLKGDENEIADIAIQEDHLFLAINFKSNLFFPDDTLTSAVQGIGVVKLDLEGNFIWTKKIGDLQAAPVSGINAINVDKFGNIFIAGSYFEYGDFDGESLENEGNDRGFLLSLNRLGAKLWVTRLSEAGDSYLTNVDFDANNNIYAVGEYSGVIEYNNGNSYLTSDNVYLQSILVGFNSAGEKVDVIEPVQQDNGTSIVGSLLIDNENNFIIGISTLGGNMVIGENTYEIEGSFLIKLDASKNVIWSAQLETGQSRLECTLVDAEDNIYVGVGGFTHLIQKYSSSGTEIFNLHITGFNYNLRGFSFGLSDEKIMVSGDMRDPTSFGDITLVPETSKNNLYLALLDVNASLAAPEESASQIQITDQTATSTHLSWENGDGTGRLVLVKKLGKVNPLHIEDGIKYAGGDGEFGAGTMTGEREYVVYVGDGSEATVTGLQPGRPYQVAVIEYSDSLSCPGLTNYLQESVAKKFFLTPGGQKFSAYPNPLTHEVLTVLLPENVSGEDVISLKDAYGRKISQIKIKKLAREANEAKVDISSLNLPRGIYYLHMTGQPAIRVVKK